MLKLAHCCLVLLCLTGASFAQSSSFSFQAALSFDPNRIITQTGGRLGDLMSQFFGAAAAQGQASVSGNITYSTGDPPTAANANIAGYQTALTDVELTLGGNVARLNLARTRQFAQTSKLGVTLWPDGAFCADLEHCQHIGMTHTPMGTMVLVMNDTAHNLVDETGVSLHQPSDAFGFMAGRTNVVGEFDPIFQTQGFGTISIDGFALGLFSIPGTNFFATKAIPAMSQFNGTQNIARTEFWIFLEGPNLPAPVKVEGVVTNIDVTK